MNSVVCFRDHRKLSLSAYLEVYLGIHRARVQSLVGIVDRLALVVNIILRVLFSRKLDLAATLCDDRIYALADQREAAHLKLEFISVANVDNDVSAQLTRDRVDRILADRREGQHSALKGIGISRAADAFYFYSLAVTLEKSFICADILKLLTKARVVASDINDLSRSRRVRWHRGYKIIAGRIVVGFEKSPFSARYLPAAVGYNVSARRASREYKQKYHTNCNCSFVTHKRLLSFSIIFYHHPLKSR